MLPLVCPPGSEPESSATSTKEIHSPPHHKRIWMNSPEEQVRQFGINVLSCGSYSTLLGITGYFLGQKECKGSWTFRWMEETRVSVLVLLPISHFCAVCLMKQELTSNYLLSQAHGWHEITESHSVSLYLLISLLFNLMDVELAPKHQPNFSRTANQVLPLLTEWDASSMSCAAEEEPEPKHPLLHHGALHWTHAC